MTTSLKPFETTKHPDGGTYHWFRTDSGLVFSVLDDKYPHHSDFELQQRAFDMADTDENPPFPETEQRFKSMKDAVDWMSSLD